jgi:hypothetical protein
MSVTFSLFPTYVMHLWQTCAPISHKPFERFPFIVLLICYFLVIGRSSDDPRNDDSAGLHGLSELFISSIWLPEPPVSVAGEQIRG